MPPGGDFPVELTDEQVAFFREQGYLSIERITTDEEIEWLKGIYDELFASKAGEDQGHYFDLAGERGHDDRPVLPQVLGPEARRPELKQSIYYHNARRLAACLLQVPEEQVGGGGHMILKPARYGYETPWHQDEAYWNPEIIPHSLSVWMPLDPASVESGCLQFIPGSHRLDILPHRHIGNNPLIHGLVTDHVDPAQAVACPIPAGGATFHHCRTLHYAGPNTSDLPRRAYILVMGGPSQKRATPAHRPWLDEEREALARAGKGGG